MLLLSIWSCCKQGWSVVRSKKICNPMLVSLFHFRNRVIRFFITSKRNWEWILVGSSLASSSLIIEMIVKKYNLNGEWLKMGRENRHPHFCLFVRCADSTAVLYAFLYRLLSSPLFLSYIKFTQWNRGYGCEATFSWPPPTYSLNRDERHKPNNIKVIRGFIIELNDDKSASNHLSGSRQCSTKAIVQFFDNTHQVRSAESKDHRERPPNTLRNVVTTRVMSNRFVTT